jgi:hypothetical protein
VNFETSHGGFRKFTNSGRFGWKRESTWNALLSVTQLASLVEKAIHRVSSAKDCLQPMLACAFSLRLTLA